MPKRPSQPSYPEANKLLEEHELARRFDSERMRIDGTFAGMARQHERDRLADEAWRRDQDVATVVLARASGVEEQLPEAIRARAGKPAPAAKPKPNLPAIGKDTSRTRLYALAGFGTALIELAIRLLEILDHNGTRRR